MPAWIIHEDAPVYQAMTTLVLLPGLDGTEIFFGPLLSQLPSWIDPVVITYPPTGPNMYLVSTNDEIIARTNLQEVLLHAPQTEVAEIEGPHLALFTNPEQSAARIGGFLRRLPCASSAV
jgi:hypothetical protein